METRIKQIIREANSRNSSDINDAIKFLLKKLTSKDNIKEKKKKFDEQIKKLKEDKKKDAEIKFLKYLYEQYLLQEKQFEEKKKRNQEMRKQEQEKKKEAEKEFQEKMRLHELKEKLTSIDWEYIKKALKDYILLNLNSLFQGVNNNVIRNTLKKNVNKVYDNYNLLINGTQTDFNTLWTSAVFDFFTNNYNFKSNSELFKLEELKDIIEKYKNIEESNSGISIDLALNFLDAEENVYENTILAIKIAHTIFMNYIKELKENFDELRKEFDTSISDKLIYLALYLNNNNIDSAREFIEQKKNSGEENSNQKPNSNFLREVYNFRTPSHNTEAEIIQEYDVKVSQLSKTQQNIILYNKEEYDLYDFIYDFLTNEDIYIDFVGISFFNHLTIKNLNLANSYSSKLGCSIDNFKKKYINYKIFEIFHTKFNEILDTINEIQLYNSNLNFHNIFRRLIFFYSEDIQDYITLDNFLKLIACVIVFFYEGGNNNSGRSIEDIIIEKITDNEERRIAIDYIYDLRKILEEKTPLKEEEYFKLFGRLKKFQFVSKIQGESKPDKPNTSETQRQQLAQQFYDRHNHNNKSPHVFLLPTKQEPKKHNTAHKNRNREQIVNRKIIATDEDRLQIIMKSFEDMDKKDSLLKPLLGFQENILFEKNDEVADINAIQELKKIYEKNKKILDYFFKLLNILSQLIVLKDKDKKDYFDIEKNAIYLIKILEQLFNIFITSISEQSEKTKITQIFNIIKANIENNIIDKYDDEKRKKFKHQEIKKRSPEDIDKYLKILGINIEEINKESSNKIINKIKTQYKKLARETHSDITLSNTNNEFHTISNAKDNLISFYSEQNSKNNNNTNENSYNYTTNKFNYFKKKYLEAYPNFIPVQSSAENYKNRENKIKYEYRKYLKNEINYNIDSFEIFRKKFLNKYLKNYPNLAEKFNSHIIKNEYIKYKNEYIKSTKKKLAEFDKELLTDIIIPKIREPINIGKLTELTPSSLTELFKLFTPFNVLYDNKFKKFNSKYGNFILSIDNNLVKRFNLYISERHNNFNKYQQLCFNMDNYIKYILHNVSFIDNIENKDRFKIIIYYNFFHNLKSIMEIILDSLTDKDPRYIIFFNLKKKLEEIIIQFKKIDKDRQYSIVLDTEKNKSGIFAQNKFNVRKVGKEQLKKQRETIMKNTKQLFEVLNKNRTNTFYKKFDETKENKDKKILLLKKIKELLDEIINEYNISFENLLKSDYLKNIITSFFEKINTNLNENYSQTYVNELISKLLKNQDKLNFLKKNIFEPVIKKLVEKLITVGYKQVKFNILELLYIFIISFSPENQQLRNIKQQRKNIKNVNNTTRQVLTSIKNEKQQQQLALIVIEQLKQKAAQLEGTSASIQVKQDELKKTLIESMKKSKVSPALMALTLSTVKPTIPTNSGRQFIKEINKLLLTNSRKHKLTSNEPTLVVPTTSSYSSLNAQNKKNVVEKLKSAITKGNTEFKKKKINEIAEEINSNRPNHITTIDQFRNEIIKRFKPKVFKLTDEEEIKFIQELSGKNRKSTDAKQKQYLEKIISIITEIKQDKSIKSLNEFKNKVKEQFESQTK